MTIEQVINAHVSLSKPDGLHSAKSGSPLEIARALREEKIFRHSIVGPALKRAQEIGSAIKERTHNLLHGSDSPLDQKHTKISRRVVAAGLDITTAAISPLSPLELLLNLKGLKDLATTVTTVKPYPENAKEARAEFLVKMLESGVSTGTLCAPIFFGVAGAGLLGVKVVKNIHDTIRMTKNREMHEGILFKSAFVAVSNPHVAKCIDLLAGTIDRLHDNTRYKVSDMQIAVKDRFLKTDVKTLIDAFYEGYTRAYPESQRETKQNMIMYLGQHKEWDLHVVQKDGIVIGGFTTFDVNLIKEKQRTGKFLILEQMFPPADQNPDAYAHVWSKIMEYAKQNGYEGIFHEVGQEERPPPGFKDVETYHAQPTLKDKVDGDRSLRMTAFLSSRNKRISASLYKKIILDGWISKWANRSDPIYVDLCHNLTERQEPYRLKSRK